MLPVHSRTEIGIDILQFSELGWGRHGSALRAPLARVLGGRGAAVAVALAGGADVGLHNAVQFLYYYLTLLGTTRGKTLKSLHGSPEVEKKMSSQRV